ncbi:MAG: hypothetical protein BGO12_18545 [Verrucomicrobia bacterium 61-8]|nr:hypothetical protein [Verrucomicrobiota bacterium]OJV13551.1 MAG: hypothetical protein BGO12_18545 [Verrucomicrobia bacterium 61-8]
MKLSLSVLVLLVLATFASQAALQDFDITATREKMGQERGRADGNTTVTTKEIRYRIEVKSRSFKALENVEVKYRVFYKDQEAGATGDGVLRSQNGSEKFPLVGAQATVTLSTKPFQLTTEQLDGNWYYDSGSGNKSSDRVAGIWVRVYINGQLSQEFCNPSTISRKADWKD